MTAMRADGERSVARIVDAATEILASDPRASMQQICLAAGLGRATVYRHFPTREVLVEAIHRRALDEAERAIGQAEPTEGPVHDALRRVITNLLDVGDRYAVVVNGRPRDPALQRRAEEVGAALVALMERGQREGVVRDDQPARWLTASLGALLVASLRMVAEDTLDRAETPDAVLALLLEGAAT